MKKLILLMMLLFSCLVNAQEKITIPIDYILETNADYHKYEKKIIECVDWLLVNPIDKNEEQRKEVNAFLIAWMAGSPDVSIELTQEVVTFTEQADALIMFMAGWTKHAIQSKDYYNLLECKFTRSKSGNQII